MSLRVAIGRVFEGSECIASLVRGVTWFVSGLPLVNKIFGIEVTSSGHDQRLRYRGMLGRDDGIGV
jgi:hypothetical protein